MDTKKSTNEDLMNAALKHYEEASSAIHHYNSDIPKAIRQFYELRSRLEPEPILLRGVDNPERIALMEKYGITEDDVTEFINGFKPKVEPDKKSAEEIIPVAYEFYCKSTGHCYVDYIKRSDLENEGDEYTKSPLFYHSQFSGGDVTDEEIEKFAKDYCFENGYSLKQDIALVRDALKAMRDGKIN